MRALLPITLYSLFHTLLHHAFAELSSPVIDGGFELESSTPFIDKSPLLLPRADAYACDEDHPCSNHACCGKVGFCGYGETYCGTTTTSPNDACWSNCDAKAECGKDAKTPGTTCPLNVCCSQYGFCGTTSDFCVTGCQSNCKTPDSGSSGSNSQKRIIGYYESWSIGKNCMGMEPNQIPVKSLTHLNYAFAYASPDTFEIGPMPQTDPKTFSQITDLKQKNGALIVGVSIGGWTFNDNNTDTQTVFHDIVSSQANRAKFTENVISFMDNYGFDAVDLDWEYPGAENRGGSGDTKDGDNYVLLVQEMKAAFKSHQRKLYLSFTAPTSYWYLRWFDIGKMAAAVDYVNFMTYDLHGTWDSTDPIGSIVLAHTNLTEIDLSLDLLWRNGVDPAKVNLGLAFYSRTFTLKDSSCTEPGCPFSGGGNKGACTDTSGILSYREIEEVLAGSDITPTYDKTNAIKYFTWDHNQWASYDDEETFQQKIKYANNQGLGGLLIWAIDQDDPNLDALRGVLYPKNVTVEDTADDVNYWNNQQPGACGTTECGGSCSPGTIEITTLKCPKGSKGKGDQKLCCPLASAPDASTCHWRGGPGPCNGQCHGGEVALASSVDGGNGHCYDGRQFYCCPIPEVADGGGINCGWKDTCSSDQTLMTFAGTFLEDIDPLIKFAGLFGKELGDALDQVDIAEMRQYCCSTEEYENWKDCYWAGTTGKGLDSCDDDHCATGIEVELTTSYFGDGESCAPKYERQRAFCCTPASGKSLFLPVPLEDLFPSPPSSDVADPVFNLETDDTWGTGTEEGKDDPNDSSFGFVVITAPSEVHVSLRKRGGSPWEVFDCHDSTSEEDQTVRMTCSDADDLGDSRCRDIHKGYGATGTIVEMPDGCGPGRYAVVKEMAPSKDQSLPHHLYKRGLRGKVYDLTFNYDFRLVPRDFGDTQMRIDFSNEEGYWDSVVDRPGQKKRKRSDMEEFRQNRKRWLEDEWADAYHKGSLNHKELHKRWFASDAIAWLANLIGVGQAKVTQELHHSVDETLSVILIDQQFGPCPLGPATAQGSLRATLQARVQVDTSFGLTIIATLTGDGLSLQDSYLYFNNKGEITASFTLDAIASLSYTTGDVKMIGLDNFPGATFRVPGIVTIGPNIEVYGRVDSQVTFAGHIEAKATIASWDVQQTYPQNSNYPVQNLEDPSQQGTKNMEDPTLSASVSVNGEVQLHLKPQVTFGIVFDSRWKVPDTAVKLALDGYVVFYAEAALSTDSDNSCPFSYGIDAGADMYAQLDAPKLFGWGGTQQITLPGLRRVPVVTLKCLGGSASKRALEEIMSGSIDIEASNATAHPLGLEPGANLVEVDVSSGTDHAQYPSVPGSFEHLRYLHDSVLSKRDTFAIGPIITIPAGFLSCPNDETSDAGGCTVCQTDNDPSAGGDYNEKKKRDDPDAGEEVEVPVQACPWCGPPSDSACTDDGTLARRANTAKELGLPWTAINSAGERLDYFSDYPACTPTGAGSVNKWYMPASESKQAGTTTCDPTTTKAAKSNNLILGRRSSEFATDHVFEVHLLGDFIYWLVGQPRNSYSSGPVRWPFAQGSGWQQPDATWAQAVLGTNVRDDGTGVFQFPAYAGDNSPANFFRNAAEFGLGGTNKQNLLAIYLKPTNGKKREWTTNSRTTTNGAGLNGVLSQLQLSANVFDYLNNQVLTAWTQGGLNMETICVQFDTAWFAANNAAARTAAPGTKFLRPATGPGGAANWGLRTVWNYWLEQHLDKINRDIPTYLAAARNEINNFVTASASSSSQAKLNQASRFLNTYMGPGAIASAQRMQFPQNAAGRLLGSANSATGTVARYRMWDGATYGVVGI